MGPDTVDIALACTKNIHDMKAAGPKPTFTGIVTKCHKRL